jgi:hypothetical protein
MVPVHSEQRKKICENGEENRGGMRKKRKEKEGKGKMKGKFRSKERSKCRRGKKGT